MANRKKVMRGLEKCTGASSDCEGCPYADENGISCSSIMNIIRDAYALLKERESFVKPQFDADALDRSSYVRVGDLIDCVEEIHFPEKAAFDIAGIIEWACGKRAVRAEEIRERETKPRLLTLEEAGSRLGEPVWVEEKNVDTVFCEVIFDVNGKAFGMTEGKIEFGSILTGHTCFSIKGYNDSFRFWTARPSEEQRKAAAWDD